MGYITEDGLKNLKAYRYVSGGYSVVDKYMNIWWEFFVKLIPLVNNLFYSPHLQNIAPNLITLVGLVISVAGASVFLYHDLTLSKPMPAWMYFFSAFCMFMYQTLDAVDGK